MDYTHDILKVYINAYQRSKKDSGNNSASSMDQVQELLNSLPPSSVNNSREIVMEAVRAFEKNPSDRTRHRLEDLGLSVDHDDRIDHMGEYEQSTEKE